MISIPGVLRFGATLAWWQDAKLELYVRLEDGQRRVTHGPVVAWVEVPEGQRLEPLLRLDQNEAQGLMDALFAAGVRPSEARNSGAAFEVQKAHLEDLRRLVFDGQQSIRAIAEGKVRRVNQ